MLKPLKYLLELPDNSRFTLPFMDNVVYELIFQVDDLALICDQYEQCQVVYVSNLVHPLEIKNPASL